MRLKQCLLSTVCLRFFEQVDRLSKFFIDFDSLLIPIFNIKYVIL